MEPSLNASAGLRGGAPENFWYFSMCVDHFVRAIVIQYKFLPLFLIFCTLSLVTVVVHEIDICNKFHLEKHNRKRAPTIRVFSKYYDVPAIAKLLNDHVLVLLSLVIFYSAVVLLGKVTLCNGTSHLCV